MFEMHATLFIQGFVSLCVVDCNCVIITHKILLMDFPYAPAGVLNEIWLCAVRSNMSVVASRVSLFFSNLI